MFILKSYINLVEAMMMMRCLVRMKKSSLIEQGCTSTSQKNIWSLEGMIQVRVVGCHSWVVR